MAQGSKLQRSASLQQYPFANAMPSLHQGGRQAGSASIFDGEYLVQCLLAVIFASTVMFTLVSVGLMDAPAARCQGRAEGLEPDGYSWCGMWQDLRAFLSFALGALVCGLIDWKAKSYQAEQQNEGGAPRKGSLYTSLLW